MTSTEMWGILVIAVVIAALAGFVIGRRQQSGGDAQLKDIAESYARHVFEYPCCLVVMTMNFRFVGIKLSLFLS